MQKIDHSLNRIFEYKHLINKANNQCRTCVASFIILYIISMGTQNPCKLI